MDQFRIRIAETVSGAIVGEVVPSAAPTFSVELSKKNTWGVELVLDGKTNRVPDLQGWATSDRYSWIIQYGSYIIEAGPPTSCAFKQADRKLSVTGAGVGALFDQRVLRNPAGTAASLANANNTVTYAGLSLRGIAQKIVVDNITQASFPAPPLTIGTPETGSNTRTYTGFDAKTVWAALTDLAGVVDGPEVLFVPYLWNNAGVSSIGWELRVGTPLLGDQAPDMAWDQGAALGAIDVDSNTSIGPVFRAWAKGSGDKESTIFGYAENAAALTAAGYPGTDYVNTEHSSVEVKATADGYAASDLVTYSGPTDTWTAAIRVDGKSAKTGALVSPALGTWEVGSKPIFRVAGHLWIPDGAYRKRVIGYTNGDPGTVNLKLAPESVPL